MREKWMKLYGLELLPSAVCFALGNADEKSCL